METPRFSRNRRPLRLTTSLRRGVAAVAACFMVGQPFANPVNPTVVSGTANFSQSGTTLTVTNSNGAIINWDKFSIKAGETTHFAQPSVSSAVLNRVLNDPSAIYGTLSSNGRAWLINPAGIMVGASGRIDTAGFVASTLNLRNEDFLAGRKLFENTPGAANVINQGEIRTPSGGSVYLVGSNVSNEGIIHTPAGETILAAGNTVSLIDSATPGVKVEITGAAGNSTNLGSITAEAGRVGIVGVIVRNSGLVNASSVVSEGGRVFLKASQDAYVDGAGRIVTTGTRGGRVEVLGERVAVMDQASIDASGSSGGGAILVGGDYQGANPEIRNASVSYFGPQASLRADALGTGDGGKVVIWADDTTRAYGSISARGGDVAGNGGLVETSGKRSLGIAGARVDTRAPNGGSGTWLLDPSDISIVSGASSTTLGSVFDPGGSTSITDGDVNTALATTNVIIQTSGGSGGSGHISATNVNIGGAANDLSLLAYGGGSATGNIQISNSAINLGSGALTLIAGWGGGGKSLATPDGTNGSITISDSLLHSGEMTLKAVGDITISGVTKGSWLQSQSFMEIEAANLYLNGGSSYGAASFAGGSFQFPNAGAGVMLQSSSTQTVKISGLLRMQAGSANNTLYGGSFYGGSVAISAVGAQDVSAQSILMYGGASGHDNSAEIVGGDAQNITIYGGSLVLAGGGGAAGYNNQARIQHGQWVGNNAANGSGNQVITLYGGASVSLAGGSGAGTQGYYGSDCYAAILDANACRGSSNGARIENLIGNQTVDFTPGGGSLSIYGGTLGSNNSAEISQQNAYGSQSILGNPTINLTGGASGGALVVYGSDIFELSNDAGIYSKGSGAQTINASSITISGGGAVAGGAGISSEGGGTLQVAALGNLTMTGGSSSSATPYGAAAYIAHDEATGSINLQVGGALSMTSGSGSSAPAVIGTIKGPTSVTIITGGGIAVTANASKAAIGSMATGYGASVTLDAGGGISLSDSTSNSGGRVLIGSLENALSDTTVILRARGDVTVGNAGGTGALIGVGNPTTMNSSVNIYAGAGGYGGNLTFNGSSQINVADGSVDLRAGQNSASTGGITLMSGSSVYGGNVTLAAGGALVASGTIHSTQSLGISAAAGVDVYGGTWAPSTYGGNMSLGGSLQAIGGGVNLYASANVAGSSGGQISQNSGSSITALDDVNIDAMGDIGLNGSVNTSAGIQVRAGYSSPLAAASPYGGNLTIGGSLIDASSAPFVHLYALSGSANGLKGDITQSSGSLIYGGDVQINAFGNANLAGTVTGTLGIVVDAGYDYILDSASARGGNVAIAATGSLQSAGTIDLFAAAGTVNTANGGSIGIDGQISAAGAVTIWGDRGIAINGSVVSTGSYIEIWSGYNDSPDYGGDIVLGPAAQVAAYGGDLSVYAVGAAEASGAITQNGGNLYANGDLTLSGDGTVLLRGRVEAVGALNGYAGQDNFTSNGIPGTLTSTYGGNLLLAGTSRLIGDHVGLYANQGQYPDGTTGHVRQGAGGQIDVVDGALIASLDVYAAGNIELLGTATVSATDPVNLNAGYDSTAGKPQQALAGRSLTIGSLVTSGGVVNLSATGPISAHIENASQIAATIANSSSGGIVIDHYGVAVPASLDLNDGATANSAVTFVHRGSDVTVINGLHSFTTYGGAGDIFVSAPENNLTYYGAALDGASAILSAGGNLTVTSALGPLRALAAVTDFGLSAGGTINVDAQVSGGNVSLSGGTVNIINAPVSATGDAMVFGSTINIGSGAWVQGANVLLRGLTLGTGTLNLQGSVSSPGEVEFNLGGIVSNGGIMVATSPTSNITGFVSGDVTLDNASYFEAGNDIDLKLTGTASTLSLLNGSYLLADANSPPSSIYLDFTTRTTPGLIVSGVGSGLFVGDLSTPATAANGLHLTYVAPVQSSQVVNELVTSTEKASATETPTESNTPPPPTTGQTDPTQPPSGLIGTTGGSEGTFGSDASGTTSGGTTSGSTTTSGATTSGSTDGSGTSSGSGTGSSSGDQSSTESSDGKTTASNGKDEKTSEKDKEKDKDKDKDKDKKDQAKEEKKDEKPAQKKVAQCSS